MMKSIVNPRDSLVFDYPKMMRHPESGLIVLFNSTHRGVVVHPGNSNHKIGEYKDNWNQAALWKDFYGNVVIHSV